MFVFFVFVLPTYTIRVTTHNQKTYANVHTCNFSLGQGVMWFGLDRLGGGVGVVGVGCICKDLKRMWN